MLEQQLFSSRSNQFPVEFSSAMDNEQWIRPPPEGQKCHVTGLARTSLSEILKKSDPQAGELCALVEKREAEGKARHSSDQ